MRPDPLTALVVDDERHVRETIVAMIERHCANVDVLATAGSVAEARRAIDRHHPDLLFLDIEMPDGNGFSLLNELQQISFDVIFVTAFDHYAIRAIKLSALDYLLKPVDPVELQRAVAKAQSLHTISAEAHVVSHRKCRRERVASCGSGRIAVPSEEGFLFLIVAELVRCRAEGNYTRLYMTDGTQIVSSRTLGDYEALLVESGFFRVHYSSLVNLRHVRKYVKGKGGTVMMSDGAQVAVSTRRKEAFLDHMLHA